MHKNKTFKVCFYLYFVTYIYEDQHSHVTIYIGADKGASFNRRENRALDENTTNCYNLKLSRNHIKVIDNKSLFEEFLDNGLKDVDMVGIDSEWKPSFGKI